MPSTYTTNGGIELIATGEQSGTWGDTTNDNLNIIDRLTNGVGSISLSGTTHTLTTSDGALSDGQYAVLVFGGTPSGTNTVTISPNTNQHVYIVKNNSGQSVVLTQGSGGNVTVANGKSAIVYANGGGAGAAVVDVTNTFNFQPLDAELTAIAALATTDGNFIVGNGSTWVAESGATARTSLGVAIGVDVQAYDPELAAIAALATTDGNFIVGNGSTWVAESGSTARTSLGLGSIATQAANNVAVTGGSITGITDLAVADGGTGVSTVPTNGQLLIGNGTGYTVANVTAGSGVSISNGSGSITISATGSGGTVTSVSGTGTVNGLTLTGTVTTTGSLTLGGTLAISNADWSGTDLSVANGGTGASSFTANNVLLGNGTSAFQVVAPGSSGNVLTSNGTTWTSAAGVSLATPLAVVGNNLAGAEIRLPEDTDNGSSYVAIKAPNALAANRTMTLPDPAEDATLGFLNIPQNSESAAYTLVLADAGKHILHPSADTTARTFTIPANGSVPFPVGTAVTFINQNGAGVITIAITTDTMRLAGAGTTGSRSLAANGIATAIKVTSTEWIISGVGLT